MGPMRTALVCCDPRLDFFLAPERRGGPFHVSFELPVGLRDLIQSTGIPHVEVGGVTVDGQPARWDRLIDGGETIEVRPRYPLEHPPELPEFLLDVHLGRLARNLRLLGFDSLHDPDAEDPALAADARDTGRILLTRDRGLLMRAEVPRGSYVRATDPLVQTVEVVDRFRLRPSIEPFTRCLVCNAELVDARPDHPGIPDGVRSRQDTFRECPSCGRVYWEGTHTDRMRRLVDEVRRRTA